MVLFHRLWLFSTFLFIVVYIVYIFVVTFAHLYGHFYQIYNRNMGLSHDSLYYFSFAVLTLNAASALVIFWPG